MVVKSKDPFGIQFQWKYRIFMAVAAFLEIITSGFGQYVQIYVNKREFLDSYSFLRYVVVPIGILDAFYSAYRESLRVLEKEKQDAMLETDDNVVSKPRKHNAERKFIEVLLIKLLIIPAGACILLMFGQKIDYGPNTHGKKSIFREVNQHKSFGYLALCNVFQSISKFLESTVVRFAINTSKKVSKFAIIHPKQFAHRLGQVKKILYYLKVLAPLIGILNKLKGNLSDAFKKYRQHRQAKIAMKVRRRLLNKMTPEEKFEDIIRHLQAMFRSRQARKRARLIAQWRHHDEVSAAVRLQAIYRAKRAKFAVKQRRKAEELRLLEEDDKLLSKPRNLSKEEKRKRKRRRQTIKSLKNEVRDFQRVQQADRALLIRPNTSFSVVWKLLRVSVIGIEVLQIVVPRLFSSGSKMNMDELLSSMLLPSDECTATLTMDSQNVQVQKRGLLRLFRRHKVDTAAALCEAPSEVKIFWITMIQTLIRYFVGFTNVVCFLDVPIVFFTGEIHEETGTIVPKPFFARWILPGLALQLLVNPVMSDVFKILKSCLEASHRLDLGRVLRWGMALLPVSYQLIIAIGNYVKEKLEQFVKKQNESTVKITLTDI